MRIIVGAQAKGWMYQRIGAFDNRMAYVLGFERLGHEVYFMGDVASSDCLDPDGAQVPFDRWGGREHFERWARDYGIWPRCCLIYNGGEATHGMSYRDAVEAAKTADLLVNISGRLTTPEIVERVAYRAFVDLDPGKTQVYHQEYGVDAHLDSHQHFFTVGHNIGTPACEIPTCGVTWRPLVHPVVLDRWPARISEQCRRFRTISQWAGKNTYNLNGRYSGQKSDSWLGVIDLPQRTSQAMEIALRVDPLDKGDIPMFVRNGWILTAPEVTQTLDGYREYIADSRAEFSVANNGYVQFHTGWFSDRTVRFLASGKPALVQSTGFERHLPTGKGLMTFTTTDEAAAAIDDINGDYLAHCRAAREIAEDYCGSDTVLRKMLEQVGL